jgi:light-regulated signal transduction histidine kinase (bacteriophytochrome)
LLCQRRPRADFGGYLGFEPVKLSVDDVSPQTVRLVVSSPAHSVRALGLPLELSSFDIADLVKEVCVEYRQMNGMRVRTHTESIRGVWCRKSMRRALENLVNNAAKYGDGDAIDIVAAQRDGRLLLSVHNGGFPIAPEQQSRISSISRATSPQRRPLAGAWACPLSNASPRATAALSWWKVRRPTGRHSS